MSEAVRERTRLSRERVLDAAIAIADVPRSRRPDDEVAGPRAGRAADVAVPPRRQQGRDPRRGRRRGLHPDRVPRGRPRLEARHARTRHERARGVPPPPVGHRPGRDAHHPGPGHAAAPRRGHRQPAEGRLLGAHGRARLRLARHVHVRIRGAGGEPPVRRRHRGRGRERDDRPVPQRPVPAPRGDGRGARDAAGLRLRRRVRLRARADPRRPRAGARASRRSAVPAQSLAGAGPHVDAPTCPPLRSAACSRRQSSSPDGCTWTSCASRR